MVNHPNRSKKKDATGSNPTGDDLREFREAHELTQEAAAKLAFSTPRTWQNWESGERRMHPAIWAWVQYSATVADNSKRPKTG